MTVRKALSAFLALAILISSVLFSYPLGISAEGENRVTAQTDAAVTQGNYGYCYVYIDDASMLASLSVSVYYDAEKIEAADSYNQISCSFYDSSNADGCIQYTYLFQGEGSSSKTALFYFSYRVKDDAAIGDTFFDIVINEAYDSALNIVPVSGSRTNFTVKEKKQVLNCYVYGTSYVYSSINNEFTVSYTLSTNEIAAGSVLIQYDSELFEVTDVTAGDFFDNKSVDINSNLIGAVFVSFSGTEYGSSSQFLDISFKVIKNTDEQSDIKMTVVELYDLERNKIIGSSAKTVVSLALDPSYLGDAPSMSVSTQYVEPGIIVATVALEKDSHLGAGDFVLKFDPSVLEYASLYKGLSPDYFIINEKNVDAGELKFSIISLTDITEASNILVVIFNVKHACKGAITSMQIEGSCVSDSMTSPIVLYYPKTDVQIPPTDTFTPWQVIAPPSCDAIGYEMRSCLVCQTVEIRESAALGHNMLPFSGADPTCTSPGLTAGEKCSRCNYTTSIEIPATGLHTHSYFEYDKNSHWSICSVCKNTFAHSSHTFADNNCFCGLANVALHLVVSENVEVSVYKQTVTVNSAQACIVAYLNSDGSYSVIRAETNPDGDGFVFIVPDGVNEAYVSIKGDYNADGKLTADDVNSLKDAILGISEESGTEAYIYDINADGKITAFDLALINAAVKDKITLW